MTIRAPGLLFVAGCGRFTTNEAPVLESMTISPDPVYIDSEVSCSVDGHDPDGDPMQGEVTWKNVTRGTTLGTGATIWLDPDDIRPGETLRCSVEVWDDYGHTARGHGDVIPVCGYADESSLKDVRIRANILFRPTKTAELNGSASAGEPWDWDGSIPDVIFEFLDTLEQVLDDVTDIWPDPDLEAAEQYAYTVEEVLELIDDSAPVLLEETVPPDPDVFPYMARYDESLAFPWGESDGWLTRDDTYEVTFQVDANLYRYDWMVFDIQDRDVLFDDDMGDWLDEGSYPLMFNSNLALESGWCDIVYSNPAPTSQYSEDAYVPASILSMKLSFE